MIKYLSSKDRMFVDNTLHVMKASKDSVGLHNVVVCKLLQKLNMPRYMKMLTYIVFKDMCDLVKVNQSEFEKLLRTMYLFYHDSLLKTGSIWGHCKIIIILLQRTQVFAFNLIVWRKKLFFEQSFLLYKQFNIHVALCTYRPTVPIFDINSFI